MRQRHDVETGHGRERGEKRPGNDVVNSRAFELLSRAGFVARGAVYAIIGVLAFRLAIGQGGKITNQQGAFHTVAHQSFGHVLLVLLAIGLGGYSFWRLVRAGLGHGPEGSDSGFDRVAALASGIAYGVLCFIAIEVLMGSASGSGNAHKTTERRARLARRDLDRRDRRCRDDRRGALPGLPRCDAVLPQGLEDRGDVARDEERWIARVGTVGYLARMVVFGLVGIFFLVKAAVDYAPRAAVGLDGALAKILHQSYGSYLLGVVAAGLIAFAIYSLSDARYRRI